MNAPSPSLSAEFAAALEWWKDAGVDMDFADDATDWLEQPLVEPGNMAGADQSNPAKIRSDASNAPQGDVQKTPEPAANLFAEGRPDSLEAFYEFWQNAPGLDGIGPRGRITPRGKQGAKLMVVVVAPEDGDKDRLLSGAQGKLLEKMLAAMGIAEEDTYVASALTRPTPMADTTTLARAGMADVLTEHIKHAAPDAVLALGANLLPLLGHETAQGATNLQFINHKSSPENNHNERLTPLLVSESLESLMASPRLKARFWRRWIEWQANR